MKKKHCFRGFDWIFTVICAVLIAVLVFPDRAAVSFYKTYGADDAVISQGIVRDGEYIEITEPKILVKETLLEDKISVTADEPDITAGIWWGPRESAVLDDRSKNKDLAKIPLSIFAESNTFSHPKNPYFETKDLPSLVRDYASKGYSLVFVTKGDSTVGWTAEMVNALRDLGLTVTPRASGLNGSYIGVVSKSEIYANADKDAQSREIILAGKHFTLESAGIYSGNYARMLDDEGKNYAGDANGINIIVYDEDNDTLIDSVHYNTNSAEVSMSRCDKLFYTEYTMVLSPRFLTYAQEASKTAGRIIRLLIAIALFVVVLAWLDARYLRSVYEAGKVPGKKYRVIMQILCSVVIILAALLFVGEDYLAENFPDITFRQLIFHLTTNLEGANFDEFKDLFVNIAKYAGAALLVSLLLYPLMSFLCKNTEKKKLSNILLYFTKWLFAGAGIFASLWVIRATWISYHGTDYLISEQLDTILYREPYYVKADDVQITFPQKKKNLIYIFLESMEISLADESSGGSKSFNAIPGLTELALQYDDFSGSDEKLNGGIPLYNTTWTVAGMVAQSSGLPLMIENNLVNQNMNLEVLLPGAYTLGDILEEQGYRNVLMMGSEAAFGNRDSYYVGHGNYEIDDYNWAVETGKIPEDYYVFWGYEDKKLFENAKERVQELASSDEPFNFTLLTVDTHFTEGYLCEDCPDLYEDQYTNVFACSDQKVSEFVNWVMEQPWAEDTVIILSGDHLCMRNSYFKDMPDGYERKTYVNVINSAKEENGARRIYSTMDLFPTTLSALGADIQGDRLGFGTDLYSDTPTLIEKYGESFLNCELSLRSLYYEANLLNKND